MKRIDATIYFPECQRSTTVWVDDDASEDEIRQAILDDAMSMIEIDFHEMM